MGGGGEGGAQRQQAERGHGGREEPAAGGGSVGRSHPGMIVNSGWDPGPVKRRAGPDHPTE
ncbi:hypothetical protein Shyd_73540 [Streptomyces hydrogenans]|uniref:Uncharacterized protein n=1 Tax=Streptomyces hydrogenans TaxID=1873719 RepID=A0ABQ3PLS8_9ACTN|nr:hypothetical protein GCM10018784_28690 [Streptomyces hydrogenans]GHI25983.1 hypothetical protein Shyd_73540 [Streptomyces hydrogenans]